MEKLEAQVRSLEAEKSQILAAAAAEAAARLQAAVPESTEQANINVVHQPEGNKLKGDKVCIKNALGLCRRGCECWYLHNNERELAWLRRQVKGRAASGSRGGKAAPQLETNSVQTKAEHDLPASEPALPSVPDKHPVAKRRRQRRRRAKQRKSGAAAPVRLQEVGSMSGASVRIDGNQSTAAAAAIESENDSGAAEDSGWVDARRRKKNKKNVNHSAAVDAGDSTGRAPLPAAQAQDNGADVTKRVGQGPHGQGQGVGGQPRSAGAGDLRSGGAGGRGHSNPNSPANARRGGVSSAPNPQPMSGVSGGKEQAQLSAHEAGVQEKAKGVEARDEGSRALLGE